MRLSSPRSKNRRNALFLKLRITSHRNASYYICQSVLPKTALGAVIVGVLNLANHETAQAEGLALIWSHRLQDLADFIESMRS